MVEVSIQHVVFLSGHVESIRTVIAKLAKRPGPASAFQVESGCVDGGLDLAVRAAAG